MHCDICCSLSALPSFFFILFVLLFSFLRRHLLLAYSCQSSFFSFCPVFLLLCSFFFAHLFAFLFLLSFFFFLSSFSFLLLLLPSSFFFLSFSFLFFFVYFSFPVKGLCFYWTLSSLTGLTQSLVLRYPWVRRRLHIPESPSETRKPVRDLLKSSVLRTRAFWADVRDKNFRHEK